MSVNTKKYKYSEKEYAELVYKNGFQSQYLQTELKLLALYFRDELKLGVSDRTEKLYEFCEVYIPNYNKAKHFKVIDGAIRYSQKKDRKFVVIPKINIYQGEVDYINSLDIDYNCKKVMFTFLVQKKLDNITYFFRKGKRSNTVYFKGGKQKYNEIKKSSKIPVNIKINDDIIYNLSNIGCIKICYSGMIELLYINNCLQTGDIVIEVKDYTRIGWYFDYYNNIDKMQLCEYCEQPFKQTKKDLKYCNEHKIYYEPIISKTITCIDCGKEVEVDARNMTKIRCDDCYKIYRTIKNREKALRYYRKCKNKT